ncbi:MAG: hypothetical protein ACKPEA_01720, partial [Planctomycetota bacterium]
AIPNVLGCALFGYVLTPETSRRVCERFATPLRWFAWATVAYQAWFIQWATTGVSGAATLAPLVTVVPLAFLFFPGGARLWPVAGSIAFVASMALFVWNGAGSLSAPPPVPTLTPTSLAWASPFMAFGFLLCPYLDPTFHRALQQSPSRHCFAVFGVTFAAALVFAASAFDARIGGPNVTTAVWAQWLVQAGFTMCAMVSVTAPLSRLRWSAAPAGAPVAEVFARAPVARLGWVLGMPAMAVVLGPMLLQTITIATKAVPALLPAPGLLPGGDATPWTAGEATYLRWLGLYGVVFPAFVLFGIRRVPMWIRVIAIALAATLADRGMLGANMPLLTAAVAVILVASLVTSREMPETAEIVPADPR